MPQFPSRTLALLLVLVAAQAQAQQYRWLDEKGRVQYTDTPPPAGAKGVQKKNLTVGKSDGSTEPYALQIARKTAPVKLYTAPDCPGCEEARKLLNKRGIPFSEIGIADAKQLEDLKKLSGGTAVPVMLVGEAMQKGFEEGAYNRALDTAGYPKLGDLKPRNQAAPLFPPKPPAEAAVAPASPAAPASPPEAAKTR